MVKEEVRSNNPLSETFKQSSYFIEKKQSKQQKSFELRNSLFGSSRGRLDCNICEKSFTKRETLKIHLRFHNGEKPFKCPDCDKRFTVRHALRYHIRTHKCRKCSKHFSSK